MGIKIINDVFDNSEMKGNDRLVMISIADNANNENRQAWPSVREISRKTRIPIRTVWRCLKRCVASGELKIVKSGTHEGESNLYEVLVRRSSPQPTDTLTGVPNEGEAMPCTGIPPVPMSGTLTVSEPSIEPSVRTRKDRGSLEEVAAFCLEEGIPYTDGDWFFNKCEGNGWINGKQTIKDWKATIRAWKSAGYMPSQKTTRSGFSPANGPMVRSIYELTKIIEAKKGLANSIKHKRSSEHALGRNWDSEEWKNAYNLLMKEIHELNGQLANM